MSIHTINDLDKISITESQNILKIINPKNEHNALVYTKSKLDIDLITLIKHLIEKNPNLNYEKIKNLGQLIDNEELDDAAKFDLKKLTYYCGRQEIKTLFDVGFTTITNSEKTIKIIKDYFKLLGSYRQDYNCIYIGNIVIQKNNKERSI
jgi:hypothetical protein